MLWVYIAYNGPPRTATSVVTRIINAVVEVRLGLIEKTVLANL